VNKKLVVEREVLVVEKVIILPNGQTLLVVQKGGLQIVYLRKVSFGLKFMEDLPGGLQINWEPHEKK
jgi:hypothetical protein